MSVTAQLTNFEATSDFSVPEFYPDDCGETAFSVLEHVRDGMALTGDAIAKVRDQMAALGLPVKGGTTMGELVDFFSQHRGLAVEYTNGYGSSWDAIHQTLLAHAGRDGVVLEVELAYKLVDNEPGVYRHFVAVGGIHPTRGYLIANGDTLDSLASHGGHGKIVPCYWMDKNQLAAARPSACAIVTGLPHTETLSAAVAEAPQARIVEGSIVHDNTQEHVAQSATTREQPSDPEGASEGQGGASGAGEAANDPRQTQPPAAVPQPVSAPAATLGATLGAEDVANIRGQLQAMQATLTQHQDALSRILVSLPTGGA